MDRGRFFADRLKEGVLDLIFRFLFTLQWFYNDRSIMGTKLEAQLSSAEFRKYYYLKKELAAFCRSEGLQVSGGKRELTERIAHYLETGEKSVSAVQTIRVKIVAGDIKLNHRIEENFVCSEKHRAFFQHEIGKAFSFSVPFQQWLKANAGKTYAEAVAVWHAFREAKKGGQGVTQISPQFEYNTYIRDFFKANAGRTLADAIRCWNYKKSLPGHNRYEAQDLSALSV